MSETQKTEKAQEEYLLIKNLRQLKQAVKEGRPFRIINHYVHPEFSGQLRKPGKVQTNGFYSKVVDNPDHVLNNANGGKGFYVAYGKASDWHFDKDGTCTLMQHAGKRRIWDIKVLV